MRLHIEKTAAIERNRYSNVINSIDISPVVMFI